MVFDNQSMAEQDIEAGVRAQAQVRARLGIPVMLLIIASIAYWGPSFSQVSLPEVLGFALLYTVYNFGTLFLAKRLRPLSAYQIVLATAVLDPLMLSGWLMLMGAGARLFVCFYLFTILGFGFRIGPKPMWICQAASLVGFCTVSALTPAWHDYPLASASNIVFLAIVPLYATVLIKKLRDARAHAERESQAKSQLLANVSHELRTPLSGIVASAQLIEAETNDPGIAQRANAILKLSRELTTEINDLLDSAKYEANAIVLESEPFDLPDVMEQLRLALGSTATAKKIELTIATDPGITQPVMGDTHYLMRVLMNLGNNAVKFTEQGQVDIDVGLIDDRAGEYVLRFSVRDTGIGIAPELHHKIFDPFFQASSGTTRKYGGTGLGTSLARQIVTLMGGQLRLESEPGKGSLFFFEVTLPKAEKKVEVAQEPQLSVVYGKRILIADDNATNLLLTKELLEKDRHSVVTARSGLEALESLNLLTFDVVFLDFNMADMDGAQVLQMYRFGKVNAAPVFFLTADTTQATADRLRDIGAVDVLHKPITLERLRGALAQLFEDEAVPLKPEPLHSAQLKVVSVGYIDHQAIDALREISSAPAFLIEILSTGIVDMERLGRDLLAALDANETGPVRDHAHALKGVCLNLGAVRLAAVASKLMQITAPELRWTRGQWKKDVEDAMAPSVNGLRAIMESAATGSV